MRTNLEIPAEFRNAFPTTPRIPDMLQKLAPSHPFQATLQDALDTEAPSSGATYTVKKGDTLSHIARQLLKDSGKRCSAAAIQQGVQQIAQANGIRNPDVIHVGQVLRFNPPPEVHMALSQKQSPAEEIVDTPATPPIPQSLPSPPEDAAAIAKELADLALPQPPPIVPHQPAEGGPVLPAPNPVNSFMGKMAEEAVDLTKLIQSILHRGGATSTDEPFKRESPWKRTLGSPARLTSEFGKRNDPFTGDPAFHDGVDLATKAGTEIFPFKEGVVSFSGWQSGYGNVVIVKHPDGIESVYGHTAKNLVKKGDAVTPQSIIAEVGSTGRSTGPHLHFEIRKRGKAVNPVPYLQEK